MRYISCGLNKKLFESIFHCISTEFDEFSFFAEGLELLKNLKDLDGQECIIFLEEKVYATFSDCFYMVLSSQERKIPVLLIGKDDLGEIKRVSHWLSENEFKYNVTNLHPFIPLFKKISKALERDEIKDLINQTIEVPLPSLEVKGKKKNFSLSNFINVGDLPPSVYNLLDFFYKNRSREVSLSEISSQLNIQESDEKRKNNEVYVYLSRVKESLNSRPNCSIKLLRTRKGHYKLFLI
ncbi:MAG: hypothetical protein K5873_09255 [Treponema sp.]|nr:hypothetical protein [Treponema sp.]